MIKFHQIAQRFCTASVTVVAALLLANSAVASQTQTTKHWEAGVGLGIVAGPDYRGAKESREFVSPFPYFVYRGKFVQADRGGVRGQLIKSDRLDFTLSMSANITPDADKNRLRRELGLGELGSSLEFGPALDIRLWGDAAHGLNLVLPLRGVVMIGGDNTGYNGVNFQPHFLYKSQIGQYHWSLRTGVAFASEDYHRYYYDIDTAQATHDYPEYRAKAGYSGLSHQLSVSRVFGDWRAAVFIRHDYLGGTEFEDSPLVQTQHSTRGGLALIWKFL